MEYMNQCLQTDAGQFTGYLQTIDPIFCFTCNAYHAFGKCPKCPEWSIGTQTWPGLSNPAPASVKLTIKELSHLHCTEFTRRLSEDAKKVLNKLLALVEVDTQI